MENTINKNIAEDFENEIIQLKNKNKELSNFIFDIVHDLKNPILVISGYLRIMSEKYKDHNKENDNFSFLRKMDKELTTLNDMFKKYLDFVLHYNSVDDIIISEIDIYTLLNYYYNYYFDIAKEKNITLIFNSPERNSSIYGNEEKIAYILSNILSNIINALERNSSIEIKFSEDINFATVNVIYNHNFIMQNSENNISTYKLLPKIILEIMSKIEGSFLVENKDNTSTIHLKFKKKV